MNEYLLIESGGPHAGSGCERFVGDATRLAADGEDVALLLIQNGVTGAVPKALESLDAYLRQGGDLWVDSFSLRQLAIRADDLLPGVRLVEMSDVAERLLRPGLRVVWH
ncbi:hypothetical protein ABZ545_06365 [Streptomyces abikoensis]|uniref:hypothetical protein n=1 Tax=Streptomyces abikoensis TaxID=97398 RepID=UPI0033F77927